MVIFAVCANLHTEIMGQLGLPEMWNWNKVELRDMNDADILVGCVIGFQRQIHSAQHIKKLSDTGRL